MLSLKREPARIITVLLFSVKAAFKIRPDCGTIVAVSFNPRKTGRPPLESETLERLALHYVGRYATTRAKLRTYLDRKIRERGWAEGKPASLDALVERISVLGYIDDRAFAESKAGALSRRGYGVRRVADALRVAGITEEDAAPVTEAAAAVGWDAALAFARRKRIGPFAQEEADDQRRKKNVAAMIRAGHPFEFARILINSKPGRVPDDPN